MMKSLPLQFKHLLSVGGLAGFLVASAPLAAAPALTLTPSVITNDFIGKITFAVTGLAQGQLVAIQKWADVNSNGVIDASEYLFQAFRVTDGRVPKTGCPSSRIWALSRSSTPTPSACPGSSTALCGCPEAPAVRPVVPGNGNNLA